jgi:HlyD family secretion protein
LVGFTMRGMRARTRWIVALTVLIGAAVGVLGYARSRRKPDVHYETVKVDRGPIIAKVTATGTLSAIVTVQVGSQVSGRVQEIKVDFNSPVKKGELIAKIDPQLFQAAVEQARANYVAAQGNLTKSKVQALDAERQYNRSRELAERKLIAQADLDTSQANYEAAKAQAEAAQGAVEQNRAAMHQAQVNLDYTTIISPINGVVISRNVDVGQTVAASLQAPTLFTIAEDLRKMQVDTNVAEADVGKLKPGSTATFTVDAYPTEKFRGRIRQIRNAPQTLQNVVTYDAVIDVDNPELKLKPGMTANVTFIYAEKDAALRVPNAAMRFRPPTPMGSPAGAAPGGAVAAGGTPRAGGPSGSGGPGPGGPGGPGGRRGNRGGEMATDRRTVWVLRGGEPVAVRIRTGVTDGSLTEIVEGEVAEGDEVVTEMSGEGARAGGPPAFRRMF